MADDRWHNGAVIGSRDSLVGFRVREGKEGGGMGGLGLALFMNIVAFIHGQSEYIPFLRLNVLNSNQ